MKKNKRNSNKGGMGNVVDSVFSGPIEPAPPETHFPTSVDSVVRMRNQNMVNVPQRSHSTDAKENSGRVSLELFGDQIHWIDQLSSEIGVKREQIIRAFISAIEESGIDLELAESEQEITKMILKRLR